jgi:hypothetical protein
MVEAAGMRFGIHWYHRGMKRLIRTYTAKDSAPTGGETLSQ